MITFFSSLIFFSNLSIVIIVAIVILGLSLWISMQIEEKCRTEKRYCTQGELASFLTFMITGILLLFAVIPRLIGWLW